MFCSTPITSSTNAPLAIFTAPDDTDCEPLHLSSVAASIDSAANQHEVLLAIGQRLQQQTAAILHDYSTRPVVMTLFVPVVVHDRLRLLYAALGPAKTVEEMPHSPEIQTPHVCCFVSGHATLDGAVVPPALLLPVYGHDGKVCCVLQLEGASFCGEEPPPAVVRNLRAAAGHSGLLEVLPSDEFLHPPRVLEHVLETVAREADAAAAKAAARRWVPDEEALECACCAHPFSVLRRRHRMPT